MQSLSGRAAAYPLAQVVVADTRTFVVESDEAILEFDPRDIARELGDAALAACRAAVGTAADDKFARRATIDARRGPERSAARDATAIDGDRPPTRADTSTEQEPCHDALASHDAHAD